MKNIHLIVLLVVIFSVIFYFYSSRSDEEIMIEYADSFVTTDGFVTVVDLSGVEVDGSTLITLEREDGGFVIVAVPSMGVNLCVAEDVVDPLTLNVGDYVFVRGEVDNFERIVPCWDSSHYFRVIVD